MFPIKGSTQIYGVIGNPVKHSLSPVFQNVGISSLGIDAVYIPLEVPKEKFEETIKGLLLLENLKGFNITVPFKEKILKFAARVSPDVEQIGSANTLKKTSEGKIELYNTDWIGFLNALKEVEDPENKTVLVLGAGGTAKAVIYALKKSNAKKLLLWNRTKEKALSLAQRFNITAVDKVEEVLNKVDIIVNTTSVGLKDNDPKLFDYSLIQPHHTVFDVIYKETPLLREAKKRGAKTLDGLRMLLLQGVESFKIWFGVQPPINEMWEALKKAFKERS